MERICGILSLVIMVRTWDWSITFVLDLQRVSYSFSQLRMNKDFSVYLVIMFQVHE